MSLTKDRDWSKLPDDLLYHISSRLITFDYLSFSKVCTSWKSAISPSPSKMPFLLFSPLEKTENYLFYDINDMSYRHVSVPYLVDKQCIGCQDGWLITVDKLGNVSLFNPVKEQHIDFPCLDGNAWYKFGAESCKAVVVWPCEKDGAPMLVSIRRGDIYLIFARPNVKWHSKTKLNNGRFQDICCVGNKVFVLGQHGEIYDVKINLSTYRVEEILGRISSNVSGRRWVKYLVDCDGNLLCVSKCIYGEEMNQVVVEKILGKGENHILNDLDGKSIFLGSVKSFVVSARQDTRLKENAVYLDGNYYCHYYCSKRNGIMIHVHDIGDKSFNTHCLPQFLPEKCIVTWFAPSMTRE